MAEDEIRLGEPELQFADRREQSADFHVERVKFLRRPENRSLALYWNEYLEDLLEICKPPSGRIAEPQPQPLCCDAAKPQ